MEQSSSPHTLVFVYGTLKTDQPNHHWLKNPDNGFMKKIADMQTLEKYPLILDTPWNIPFLLDAPGFGEHILGEVYKVDEAMLSNLDVLEGYPKWYDRKIIKLKNEEVANELMEAQVYLLSPVDTEKIVNRKFIDYFDHKKANYVRGDDRPKDYKNTCIDI